MTPDDIIIKLHELVRLTDDPRIAKQLVQLADTISDQRIKLYSTISREAEDLHSDKGYELSTLEKQAEFAKNRKDPWDEWKSSK